MHVNQHSRVWLSPLAASRFVVKEWMWWWCEWFFLSFREGFAQTALVLRMMVGIGLKEEGDHFSRQVGVVVEVGIPSVLWHDTFYYRLFVDAGLIIISNFFMRIDNSVDLGIVTLLLYAGHFILFVDANHLWSPLFSSFEMGVERANSVTLLVVLPML